MFADFFWQPPESRTGRHRVLSQEIEAVSSRHPKHSWSSANARVRQALCEHVKDKPDMSVDDMLWWLYDNYKMVVGTRTIRRVFERKGETVKPSKSKKAGAPRKSAGDVGENDPEEDESQLQPQTPPPPPRETAYKSPYPPLSAPPGNMDVESQLRQAMQPEHQQQAFATLANMDEDLPDDEETIQLQLQQIALQKREVELKLKMRRLAGGKGTPQHRNSGGQTPSSLYNPQAAMVPQPPKRDSRSKKKIEESKKRTAERQERMLRDLERRSRRRDHLTAEWVQSKDIWPLRAQGKLADLMHYYGCYSYSQNNEATFDAMYQELYQLVDMSKGDWQAEVHDDMLRERMKRKMGQLRTKMQKTGEIVGRTDNFGGFQKAENYTGEAAGATVGDESEMIQDPALQADVLQAQPGAPDMQQPHPEHMQHAEHLQYEHVPPDAQMQHMQYPNPMLPHQVQGQYPMMDHNQNVMPYAQMPQGLGHDNMIV